MDRERVFVVVIGTDQKGIIARISTLLFEQGANIEDVQQKVMDGTFVMTMLVDVGGCKVGLSGLRKSLEEAGQAMGLTVMVHNESVVKAMHRV
jgi:predicted amino acid-binding ACT domain protein